MMGQIMKAVQRYRRRLAMRKLASPDYEDRVRAIQTLRTLQAPHNIELLIQALRDESMVRFAAAEALGELGDPRAAGALIPLLRDSYPSVRNAAEDALVRIGPEAVGLLITAMRDPSTVNEAAVRVITRIEQRAWTHRERWASRKAIRPLVKALKQALGRDTSVLREAIVEALRSLGWKPVESNQRALWAVARRDWDEAVSLGSAAIEPLLSSISPCGWEVVKALGEVGDRRVVPKLIKLLEERWEWCGETQKAAVEAIGRIGDKTAVKPLMELSERSWAYSPETRLAMLKALGDIGDPSALETFKRALSGALLPDTRQAAAEALGRIEDPNVSQYLLIAALRDKERGVREAAAKVLRMRGWRPDDDAERAWFGIALRDWALVESAGKEALWPLVETLVETTDWDMQDADLRSNILQRLQKIRAVDILADAITSYSLLEGERRATVARALGILEDRRGVEALLLLTSDPNESVRFEAVRALGEIRDPRAVGRLTALLGDEKLCRWAATALGKIGDGRAIEPLLTFIRERHPAFDPRDDESFWKPFAPLFEKGEWDDTRMSLYDSFEPLFEAALALVRLGDAVGMLIVPRAIHLAVTENVYKLIDALEQLESGEAMEHLMGLLRHRDARVRRKAASSLESIKWRATDNLQHAWFATARQRWEEAVDFANKGATEPLVAMLWDEDETIRESAIEALEAVNWQPQNEMERAVWTVARTEWADAVAIGAPAVDPLLHALKEWDSSWLADIVEALGKIADVKALEPMMEIVSDKKQEMSDAAEVSFMMRWVHVSTRDGVRRLAIEALGRIGDQRAVDLLAAVLRDEHEPDFCRTYAARALGDIGGDQALAALRSAAIEADGEMKSDLEEVLEGLQNHRTPGTDKGR